MDLTLGEIKKMYELNDLHLNFNVSSKALLS